MNNDLRNYRDVLIEELRNNPEEAKSYLEVALDEYEEDGNSEAFLLALRTVAEAQGGIAVLAKKIDMSRQSLYKALSAQGNPRLNTIDSILHGLGFRFALKAC
jgi:probable addiction module antidote protein